MSLQERKIRTADNSAWNIWRARVCRHLLLLLDRGNLCCPQLTIYPPLTSLLRPDRRLAQPGAVCALPRLHLLLRPGPAQVSAAVYWGHVPSCHVSPVSCHVTNTRDPGSCCTAATRRPAWTRCSGCAAACPTSRGSSPSSPPDWRPPSDTGGNIVTRHT